MADLYGKGSYMSIFTSNLRFMEIPPVVDIIISSHHEALSRGSILTIPQHFSNWPASQRLPLLLTFRFADLSPFRAIRWDKLVLLNMVNGTFDMDDRMAGNRKMALKL